MSDRASRPRGAADVWPVVVVGAGAAGLMTAIFAGRGGARTLVLETRPKPGAKIRVSGGGRCNVLPSVMELEDFHTSGSSKTMRNILFSWPLAEVTEFFEKELGVSMYVEDTGKVFPVSNRSQDVLEALLAEVDRCGAEVRAPFRAVSVSRVNVEGSGEAVFEIESDQGERVLARRVVFTTGGLSLPKTGSDGGGFEMARSLGHDIEVTYPALVPLKTEEEWWKELSGISLPARIAAVRAGKTIEEREGDFLFTHRGFSGPVVLDMSRHVAQPDSEGIELRVRWGGAAAPDWNERLRAPGKVGVLSLLREAFPRRLCERILKCAGVPVETYTSELTKAMRGSLVDALESYRLPVSGNEGYATAEVTAGGIPLSALKPKTLESRDVSGLYFAGEIIDVVGRIGGFNFLWAWVTGKKAGEAVARSG